MVIQKSIQGHLTWNLKCWVQAWDLPFPMGKSQMLLVPPIPHLFNGNDNSPVAFVAVGKFKAPWVSPVAVPAHGMHFTNVCCLCVFPVVISVPGAEVLGLDLCCLPTQLSDLGQLLIYLFRNFIICKLNTLLFSEYITYRERHKNLHAIRFWKLELGHYSEHCEAFPGYFFKPFWKWAQRTLNTVD